MSTPQYKAPCAIHLWRKRQILYKVSSCDKSHDIKKAFSVFFKGLGKHSQFDNFIDFWLREVVLNAGYEWSLAFIASIRFR